MGVGVGERKQNRISEHTSASAILVAATRARAKLYAPDADTRRMWVNGVTADTGNFYKLLENGDSAAST
jgi:hypothetical protein